MKPITRKEQFITAAAEGTTPPKPVTREELILAGVDIPPLTRDEYFLEKMSEGGGEIEMINGTLENPFSMEVASDIWEHTLNDSGRDVSIFATVLFSFGGTPYPMILFAAGSEHVRVLSAGLCGFTDSELTGSAGALWMLDDIDHPGTPLEQLFLVNKAFFTVTAPIGGQKEFGNDMSALFSPATQVVTIISRFKPFPTD